MTLVEVLVAVVILALAGVAIVGGLAAVTSASGANRVEVNVAATVRSAAEAIKAAPYIACSSASFDPGGVSGYSSSLPAVTITDPPGNPPAKATILSVTGTDGTPLVQGCASDPGLQIVTVGDASTDGKVTSKLLVTKSALNHAANPPVTPTGTASASPTTELLTASATDSVTITGTGSTTPTGKVHFYVCGPTSAASACASGAANSTDLNTVTVTGSAGSAQATSPAFTAQSVGTWCFLAAYLGDSNYNALSLPNQNSSPSDIAKQCYQVTAPPSQFPLLVLGTTSVPTVTVSGAHGTLTVNGPLMVNSSTNNSVSTATAGDFTSSGTGSGYFSADTVPASTCTGAGCPAGTSWTHLSAQSDPLATLAAPSSQPTAPACTKSGSTETCQPGTYTNDPKPGGGGITSLVFNSGIYVFNNGLTINGNLNVQSGAGGVLFYLAGGKLTITATTVSLSPETSGSYKGTLIFQGRSDANAVVLGGNTAAAGSLGGTVYLPDAAVQFNNNGNKTLSVTNLEAQAVTVSDSTTVVIG